MTETNQIGAERRTRDPQHSKRLPNLLLAGIGKAGSTSLFWYMSQHPEVCPSSVKEPRYFLALSDGDDDAEGVLPPIDGYTALFSRCGSERYAMEATPHYFHGGRRLIAGIKETLPDPRIVLTLRDPIERTWSIFRFAKSIMQLPARLGFDEYLDRCEHLYRAGAGRTRSNRPYWSIRGGMYRDYLPAWLDGFSDDRLRLVFFERFVRDVRGTVRDLCAWLDIDAGVVESFDLSVENRSSSYRNPVLHRLALAANREGLLRNRRRLKAPLRRVYQVLNLRTERNTMPEPARARLQELFAPSNEAVAVALTERGYTDLPGWLRVPYPSADSA